MNKFMEEDGYTLAELLIVLALIGVMSTMGMYLGQASIQSLEHRRFEAECKKVYTKVIQTQNEAMITASPVQKNEVTFYEDCVIYRIYDVATGRRRAEALSLAYSTLQGNLWRQTIGFGTAGTVTKGGTLIFSGKHGERKYMVIQIGNGRIYLTDQPPE